MTYHALLEYIRKAKDCGASDEEVASRLRKAGWYQVDVQDALELYHRLTANTAKEDCAPAANVPKPSLAERMVPRHYDPHLIAVASLSFSLGFLAYVWFTR